jgi:hypothetical protein
MVETKSISSDNIGGLPSFSGAFLLRYDPRKYCAKEDEYIQPNGDWTDPQRSRIRSTD